ncbi:MAG: hypothetical protein OXE17_03555 [Chloroflexi bacterium]|nr:hypothetical protein [Chloroflexota bacterium]
MPSVLLATTSLVVAMSLLLGSGCDTGGSHQVRGQVVEAVPRSFSELEVLRIRDDEGREYEFKTEGFIGFTPSHVREHQLFGQSLLVTYEKRGDLLIALKLED